MLFRYITQGHFGYLLAGGLLLGVLISLPERCAPPPNMAPKFIKESVTFTYPLEAYDQKIEGTVVLRIFVNESGQVQKAQVWRSSGFAVLDSSALAFAEKARFKPGRVNGNDRGMWLTWPLVYTFDSIAEDTKKWQEKVRETQYQAERAKPPDTDAAQYQLLVYYRGMARKMVDDRDRTLNATILAVVDPAIRRHWQRYEDIWPMSFLLFLDYLYRFPEGSQYKTAREYLLDYLKYEISLLRYSIPPENERESRLQKELLQDLREYMSSQFPNASL